MYVHIIYNTYIGCVLCIFSDPIDMRPLIFIYAYPKIYAFYVYMHLCNNVTRVEM